MTSRIFKGKEECLDRLIPLSERHYRRALAEFVVHTVNALRTHRASAKWAGTVLGLLYVVLYTAEWAMSDNESISEQVRSGSYRINSDDWNVVTGVPLSVAVITLGWSLFRIHP